MDESIISDENVLPDDNTGNSTPSKKKHQEYKKFRALTNNDEESSEEVEEIAILNMDAEQLSQEYCEAKDADPLSLQALLKCWQLSCISCADDFEEILEAHPELEPILQNPIIFNTIHSICSCGIFAVCAEMLETRLVNIEKRDNGEEWDLPEDDFEIEEESDQSDDFDNEMPDNIEED